MNKKENVTVAICSGKGGAGKTTVSSLFILSAKSLNISVEGIDCDVEEPNLHLFVNLPIIQEIPVKFPFPSVIPEKCNGCGKCQDFCQFNAIIVSDKAKILSEFCHRCGGCKIVCPTGAITETLRQVGKIIIRESDNTTLISGFLSIGDASPTPIIRQAKSLSKHPSLSIIDTAPGSGCTLMDAVEEADICIGVIEDTPFGVHDFEKTYAVLKKMGIEKIFAIINKYIPNTESPSKKLCQKLNVPIILTIPLTEQLHQQYTKQNLWQNIDESLKKQFTDITENILHKWRS